MRRLNQMCKLNVLQGLQVACGSPVCALGLGNFLLENPPLFNKYVFVEGIGE